MPDHLGALDKARKHAADVIQRAIDASMRLNDPLLRGAVAQSLPKLKICVQTDALKRDGGEQEMLDLITVTRTASQLHYQMVQHSTGYEAMRAEFMKGIMAYSSKEEALASLDQKRDELLGDVQDMESDRNWIRQEMVDMIRAVMAYAEAFTSREEGRSML